MEINPNIVATGVYEFDVAFRVPLPQAAGVAALQQTIGERLHVPETHNLVVEEAVAPPGTDHVGAQYLGKVMFVKFENDGRFGAQSAGIGIRVREPSIAGRALAAVTRNKYKPKVWVTATAIGGKPDNGGDSTGVTAPDNDPSPLLVGAR